MPLKELTIKVNKENIYGLEWTVKGRIVNIFIHSTLTSQMFTANQLLLFISMNFPHNSFIIMSVINISELCVQSRDGLIFNTSLIATKFGNFQRQ